MYHIMFTRGISFNFSLPYLLVVLLTLRKATGVLAFLHVCASIYLDRELFRFPAGSVHVGYK